MTFLTRCNKWWCFFTTFVFVLVLSGFSHGAYMDRELAEARERAMEKDFEGALDIYEFILDDDPENIEALSGRARVLAWMGRYKSARSAYREVLRLDPGSLESITGIADTYAWDLDYEKAKEILERERVKNPGSREILIRLARYNLRTGNRDEALYYARVILDDDPRDRDALEIRRKAAAIYSYEAFFGYSYLSINNSSDGHNLYGGTRYDSGDSYTVFGRLDFLDRFNETEGKITAGGSYRLSDRLQLSSELGFAPGADIFPTASGLVELATPALASWVVSGSLHYSYFDGADLFGISMAGEYYPYGYLSILSRFTLSKIEFDRGGSSTDGAFLLKTTLFLGSTDRLYAYFVYGNEAHRPNTIDRVGDIDAKILGFGGTVFFTHNWGVSPTFEYLDKNEDTRYMQVGLEILHRW